METVIADFETSDCCFFFRVPSLLCLRFNPGLAPSRFSRMLGTNWDGLSKLRLTVSASVLQR